MPVRPRVLFASPTLRLILQIWICGLFILAAPVSWALDLRVVVDVSKSAHEADPLGMRSRVMDQLVHRLPPRSQAGIWAYSRYTQRLAKFSHVDALWKQVASIHATHLSPAVDQSDMETALQMALFDLDEVERGPIHLLILSNGQLENGTGADGSSRARILNDLLPRLSTRRVIVHTIGFGEPGDSADVELLRQLADVTGGLHRVVASEQAADVLVTDVLRVTQAVPEAMVDEQGRFQVPPGTEQFTVLWRHEVSGQSEIPGSSLAGSPAPTGLVQPDGRVLNRKTPMSDGRWLLAADYEMATVVDPAPGWWQAVGQKLQQIEAYTEMRVRIDGVISPVMPTDEASARIRLFSGGQAITNAGFLDLLDVRAWLVRGRERSPLPVERVGEGFDAFFVSMDDGAYDLEVNVVGPTFAQRTILPFIAQNPLRIELKQSLGEEAVAWLSFNHSSINYATVKSVAKVRKPPQIGVLVPGEKLPNGLWRIPLSESEGVLEATFSVSGNYLNNEGFFLKTKSVPLDLPLPEAGIVMRFDAAGKRLADPSDLVQLDVNAPTELTLEPDEIESGPGETVATSGPSEQEVALPQAPPVPTIPWWFVAAISLVNLCLAGLIYWFLKPSPLPPEVALSLSADAATLDPDGSSEPVVGPEASKAA